MSGIPYLNSRIQSTDPKNGVDWEVVNKEIINQAALELNIPSKLLEEMAKNKPKGIFEELFLTFSDIHLPSDVKIKKTVARILRTIALHGNVVLLGRGGVVLSRDIKNSLHVNLHASVSWRMERVKKLENITSDNEALGRMKVVDSERVYLLSYFAGENLGSNIFDVTYNCEFLSEEEIIESILHLAAKKGI